MYLCCRCTCICICLHYLEPLDSEGECEEDAEGQANLAGTLNNHVNSWRDIRLFLVIWFEVSTKTHLFFQQSYTHRFLAVLICLLLFVKRSLRPSAMGVRMRLQRRKNVSATQRAASRRLNTLRISLKTSIRLCSSTI